MLRSFLLIILNIEVMEMDTLLIIWVVLFAVFVVFEAVTVQLVSIWLAIGCLGGVIANLCGASTTLQIAIVIILSVICLIITKPLAKKLTKNKADSKTNADLLIGKEAIALEDVDNIRETGYIKVNGVEWNVKSFDNKLILKGTKVEIKDIVGSKLIVDIVKE